MALVLSTSLCAPLAPSFAATVEQLAPAPITPATYPGAEQGALRTWVQLVWNPITRRLERLSLTAFDPIPSLGLELQWTPDDPADNHAGPLDGRGTLSFRKPGAASYDPSATLAQYRGAMHDGRPEGFGEFLDRNGFSYAGAWHLGLMDGQGRLVSANGDEYVGAFKVGRRDGMASSPTPPARSSMAASSMASKPTASRCSAPPAPIRSTTISASAWSPSVARTTTPSASTR